MTILIAKVNKVSNNMKNLRVFFDLIIFVLTARNTGGFGVHSPSLFHLVKFVFAEKNPFYVFAEIEKLRSELLHNKQVISLKDFGTGFESERKISEIAKKSLKSKKQAQLLFRLVNEYKPLNILELGTSLGITSLYLAASNQNAKCITLEGCPETAKIAMRNIEKLKLNNIEVKVGEIGELLPKVLTEFCELDFVFIDANHTLKAVISYFEQCLEKINSNSIIVIDDIYWSVEMKKAWKLIKENNKVSSTIDLFQMGIVFFNPHLQKKHYKFLF